MGAHVAVKVTDDGCSPAKLAVPAGPMTVSVSTGGTSAVTEMELDAGLFFICFQRDPHRQFAAIQRRLGPSDVLDEYIQHCASALFAIPRGVRSGGFVAEGLFALSAAWTGPAPRRKVQSSTVSTGEHVTTSPSQPAISSNDEAIRAWDGPLYDRFVRFREIVTTGLGAHGEEALRLNPPQAGQRVLDVGCGFGDTTQRIAELVGPQGEAVGVDAAPRFIEDAVREAREAGVTNARFLVADVQHSLGEEEGFDVAFSRFGTMFFASPVAALRNVRGALVPGGRLVMVVWRRRTDNDWLYRAQTIVEGIVERPEEYDEPTCGPGPFSMADADTTSEILLHAGFEDISLRRCDLPIGIGKDINEALDLVMALGPAGEILRLAGERAAHLHGQVEEALRAGLAEFEAGGELVAAASTWIVTATAPVAPAGA
jgi:ubiquinone/menaquinone biosynthesis C-methylase UbiE